MSPLISVSDLARLDQVCILDARFRIKDPAAAEQLFKEGHIPGAFRVDLERDLSGPKTGTNGRHPLPMLKELEELFSRLGISADLPVVIYDDADHSGAARAWMLLRLLGHEKVQVLDGGLKAWIAEGQQVEKGGGSIPTPAKFIAGKAAVATHEANFLANKNLVDVRAPERFRGEVEPLDPVAGHIPNAKNLPYPTFLGTDGKFLPPDELKIHLSQLGPSPVFYCGSGVTACVALLAAELAGVSAGIYPGSWSEWCSLPNAKVAKG